MAWTAGSSAQVQVVRHEAGSAEAMLFLPGALFQEAPLVVLLVMLKLCSLGSGGGTMCLKSPLSI